MLLDPFGKPYLEFLVNDLSLLYSYPAYPLQSHVEGGAYPCLQTVYNQFPITN